MKPIVGVLMLFLAPAVFAAPRQTTPAEPASQASNDSPRSPSTKATSRAHHVRKHRDGSHHRRPRTTAKSHKL